MTYAPFIGETSDPAAPSPPSATLEAPDDPGFTKGIRFECAAQSLDFMLTRSMNLGDRDQLIANRINRTSRGGTLVVFADPMWPRFDQLVFTISAVKRTDARDMLTFLKASLGCEIDLTTHEGRKWKGVVTNPDNAVIQDRDESYTISVEFQGEEV